MDIDAHEARSFAVDWIAAWNRRDLDAVLQHYAGDVRFISPTAARVVPSSGGIIVGIDALREYWSAALPLNPGLHFELLEVLDTVGGLTIVYRNDRDQLVSETLLRRDDGAVWYGVASYSRGPSPLAAGSTDRPV